MPTKFVSNLPYQAAATLILKFFQELPSLGRAVVMVQAEVADRIAASLLPRHMALTPQSCLVAQVTGRFEVGPGSLPPPLCCGRMIAPRRRNPLTSNFFLRKELLHTIEVGAALLKDHRNSIGASGFDKDKLDRSVSRHRNCTINAEVLTSQDFICLAALWSL